MSSVSVISNVTSTSAAVSATASTPAEQITAGLQALSTAIQSGDTAGASTALTAIKTAFAATNPSGTVTDSSLQVQGDLTAMQQALASGNSNAMSSAFTTLQKDVTTPSTAASLEASAATPAYVLSLLSALPDDNSVSSADSTDVGSNLLAALSTQNNASNTAALNVYA